MKSYFEGRKLAGIQAKGKNHSLVSNAILKQYSATKKAAG